MQQAMLVAWMLAWRPMRAAKLSLRDNPKKRFFKKLKRGSGAGDAVYNKGALVIPPGRMLPLHPAYDQGFFLR